MSASIHIGDTGLRRALGLAFGDAHKTRFAPSELATLDRLSWSGWGEAEAYPDLWQPIRSLAGLEGCTGLRELSCMENHIADLSPLAELTELTELWAGDNAVESLAPLAGLTKLRHLVIRTNPLAALQGLETLTTLVALDISETRVTDLSPLAGLVALETLDLSGLQVASYAPLADLPALRQLKARKVSEPDDANLAVLSALVARGVQLDSPTLTAALDRHAAAQADTNDIARDLEALGLADAAARWALHGPAWRDFENRGQLHALLSDRATREVSDADLAPLVQRMIDAGYDPNRAERVYGNDLGFVTTEQVRRPQTFDVVLAATVDINWPPHAPPLRCALSRGRAIRKYGGDDAPDLVEVQRRIDLLRARTDATLPAVISAWAAHGQIEEVRRCLTAGADPRDPSALWAASDGGHGEVIDLLLAAGSDPNQIPAHKRTPAWMVAKDGATLRRLLAGGADLHSLPDPWDHLGRQINSGDASACAGAIEVCEVLLEHLEVSGVPGVSALQGITSNRGSIDRWRQAAMLACIERMIAAGADPLLPAHAWDEYLEDDQKARLEAAGGVNGDFRAWRHTLEQLANADSPLEPGSRRWRAIEAHSMGRSLPAVTEAVLSRLDPTHVLATWPLRDETWARAAMAHVAGGIDSAGKHTLQRAADDLALFSALVRAGIVTRAYDGKTALTAVCDASEDLPEDDVLRAICTLDTPRFGVRLLPALADCLRERDAHERDLADLVDLAIQHGLTEADLEGVLAFDRADLLARLLDAGLPVRGRAASCLLTQAIEVDALECARLLLDRGAPPEGVFRDDDAVPLHKVKSPEAVHLLADHGAWLEHRAQWLSPTPLLAALRMRGPKATPAAKVAVARALLARGADAAATDEDGKTLIDDLKALKGPEAKALLGELG